IDGDRFRASVRQGFVPTRQTGGIPLADAARAADERWSAIGNLVDLVTPTEPANAFTAAGHQTD
ncbi:MAG: hypothetical protein AAFX62_12035, partial [Pseudomonadota bacterium]